jgi:hypothetical protein
VPYDPKDENGTKGCCPSQTPDHLLPKASFFKGSVKEGDPMDGWDHYNADKAPCMCAEGSSNHGKGSHPLRHAHHKAYPPAGFGKGDPMPFDKAIEHSAKGASEVFAASGCTPGCIEAQLQEQHKKMAEDPNAPGDVKYKPSGSVVEQSDVTTRVNALNPGIPGVTR